MQSFSFQQTQEGHAYAQDTYARSRVSWASAQHLTADCGAEQCQAFSSATESFPWQMPEQHHNSTYQSQTSVALGSPYDYLPQHGVIPSVLEEHEADLTNKEPRAENAPAQVASNASLRLHPSISSMRSPLLYQVRNQSQIKSAGASGPPESLNQHGFGVGKAKIADVDAASAPHQRFLNSYLTDNCPNVTASLFHQRRVVHTLPELEASAQPSPDTDAAGTAQQLPGVAGYLATCSESGRLPAASSSAYHTQPLTKEAARQLQLGWLTAGGGLAAITPPQVTAGKVPSTLATGMQTLGTEYQPTGGCSHEARRTPPLPPHPTLGLLGPAGSLVPESRARNAASHSLPGTARDGFSRQIGTAAFGSQTGMSQRRLPPGYRCLEGTDTQATFLVRDATNTPAVALTTRQATRDSPRVVNDAIKQGHRAQPGTPSTSGRPPTQTPTQHFRADFGHGKAAGNAPRVVSTQQPMATVGTPASEVENASNGAACDVVCVVGKPKSSGQWESAGDAISDTAHGKGGLDYRTQGLAASGIGKGECDGWDKAVLSAAVRGQEGIEKRIGGGESKRGRGRPKMGGFNGVENIDIMERLPADQMQRYRNWMAQLRFQKRQKVNIAHLAQEAEQLRSQIEALKLQHLDLVAKNVTLQQALAKTAAEIERLPDGVQQHGKRQVTFKAPGIPKNARETDCLPNSQPRMSSTEAMQAIIQCQAELTDILANGDDCISPENHQRLVAVTGRVGWLWFWSGSIPTLVSQRAILTCSPPLTDKFLEQTRQKTAQLLCSLQLSDEQKRQIDLARHNFVQQTAVIRQQIAELALNIKLVGLFEDDAELVYLHTRNGNILSQRGPEKQDICAQQLMSRTRMLVARERQIFNEFTAAIVLGILLPLQFAKLLVGAQPHPVDVPLLTYLVSQEICSQSGTKVAADQSYDLSLAQVNKDCSLEFAKFSV